MIGMCDTVGPAAVHGFGKKLLQFWTFFREQAGAARTALSIRDLLAWVSGMQGCPVCGLWEGLATHMLQSRLLHMLYMPGCCRVHLYGRCHLTYSLDPGMNSSHATASLAAAFMLYRLLVSHPRPLCLRCPCHCFCHVLQVDFINKAATRLGPAAAYAHGAHMVLLDGIGLGVGMPPQVGACCTGTCALVCGLQKGAFCLHMQPPGGGQLAALTPFQKLQVGLSEVGTCWLHSQHPRWGLQAVVPARCVAAGALTAGCLQVPLYLLDILPSGPKGNSLLLAQRVVLPASCLQPVPYCCRLPWHHDSAANVYAGHLAARQSGVPCLQLQF